VVLQRRARRQFQDAQFGLVPSLSQMDLYLLRGNGEAKSVNGSAAVEEISEARTRGPQGGEKRPNRNRQTPTSARFLSAVPPGAAPLWEVHSAVRRASNIALKRGLLACNS
jgi:hypothetical protein